ncbi:MAG: hypothetical protein B7C24_14740 [Bacteroidetes bacterium 4572_77]|nr:MAG: hypothetical protein B7C24_14740 [Bacteroidetes bacterium 4572_77]
MFDKLMNNLGPMKEAMDTAKKKLDTISVKGEAEDGLVRVYVNGNRRVTDIHISPSLMTDGDKFLRKMPVLNLVYKKRKDDKKIVFLYVYWSSGFAAEFLR